MAFFSACAGNGTDRQFREALKQELFRRGLLAAPRLSPGTVNVDEFTQDGMESVNYWFACDQIEHTVEDRYVKLFTGRDRWAERNNPKRKRDLTKKVT